MTENTYISELARMLSAIPARERQEILDDYRRHFRDGRAAGESDEEIVSRLGSPDEVAGGFFDGCQMPPPPPYGAPPPPPPPPPPPHPPLPGVPHWAKVMICCAGVFWLVVALGFTARMLFTPTRVPATYIFKPQATAVELPAADYNYEIITRSDDFLNALRQDIERAVQDSGNTHIISEESYALLEEYAQDWSRWIPGQGVSQMEQTNSLFAFEESEVYSIELVGSYNMSVNMSASYEVSDIEVLVSGDIAWGHGVNVDLYGSNLVIQYANGGSDVNIPYGSQLNVHITVPASWNGDVSLSTISGGIYIDGSCSFPSVTAQSISGSIRIDGTSGSVMATSVNGSIMISGVCEIVNTSNVSGNTKVMLMRQPEGLNMSSVSGGLGLFMDGEYLFKWRSVSSALFNNSGGIEGENAWFTFVTVSGDVYLEPYTQ